MYKFIAPNMLRVSSICWGLSFVYYSSQSANTSIESNCFSLPSPTLPSGTLLAFNKDR